MAPLSTLPLGRADVSSDLKNSIVFHTVVVSIMTIAASIRVYTRAVVKKRFGADDYILLVAWALSLSFSGTFAYGSKYGFEKYFHDIPQDALKLLTISLRIYLPVTLAVKLSILIGYNRIFKIDTITQWLIWCAVVALSLFYVIGFAANMARCKPMERAWNLRVKGTCKSYGELSKGVRIFNIISDFYILIIPMPLILRLTLSWARRIRIAVAFGIGFFTCICSVMLCVVTPRYTLPPEQSYATSTMMYWAVLEVNVGIICACVPVFHAFFDPNTPKSLGWYVAKLFSREKQ